jgi:hypothetical protein
MLMTPRSLGALCLAAALGSGVALAQQPAPTAPSPNGIIVGYIFDSTVTRPLADATVQIVAKSDLAHGRSFSVSSDSSGFFRVIDVPAGDYLVTFFHPRLDELGLNGPTKILTVSGARTDIELGIPQTRHVIALHCGTRSYADSSGLLLGTVTQADAATPVAGATVTAQWFEVSFSSRGMVRSTPTVRATTDVNGRFSMCRLPGDAALNVWAGLGKAVTGAVSVDVKPQRVATIDLSLDVADTVLAATPSGPVRRGTARVSGVVRAPSGGVLPGARVALRGTDNETVADAAGAFTLTNLPGGTQTLEARAIGFVPIARSITLSAKRPLRFDIRFDSAARILQTVEVKGERVYDSATQEFMNAKKRGFGYFLDRESIENRQAFQTSDLLRAAPGVSVYNSGAPGTPAQIQIRGSSSFSGVCQPSIVLDGLQMSADAVGDIDMLARPEDIAGIAVYRGASEVPVEYSTGSSCGLIQIWTRRGTTPHGKAK